MTLGTTLNMPDRPILYPEWKLVEAEGPEPSAHPSPESNQTCLFAVGFDDHLGDVLQARARDPRQEALGQKELAHDIRLEAIGAGTDDEGVLLFDGQTMMSKTMTRS